MAVLDALLTRSTVHNLGGGLQSVSGEQKASLGLIGLNTGQMSGYYCQIYVFRLGDFTPFNFMLMQVFE